MASVQGNCTFCFIKYVHVGGFECSACKSNIHTGKKTTLCEQSLYFHHKCKSLTKAPLNV